MDTPNNEKKPQTPDIIVIPDECGDSLWDEVLAQQPDLTAIINKHSDTASDQPSSTSNIDQPNHK